MIQSFLITGYELTFISASRAMQGCTFPNSLQFYQRCRGTGWYISCHYSTCSFWEKIWSWVK